VLGARWAARAVVAAVALALALGGAGCASSGGGTTVKKAAILLPGSLNEPEWTQRSREAFEDLVARLRLRGSVASAERPAQAKAALEQLAGEKPQLVIADDSHYAAAAAQVADATKVPMLVWNDRAATKPGRVGDVEVDGRAAAYIAGVIGARAAIAHNVGIVVAHDGAPSDLRQWYEMAGAYAAGARSTDSRVKVHYAEVGGAGDATDAEVDQATTTLMKHRAENILVLGGRTSAAGFHAIVRANHHGLYFNEQLFVGVIGSKDAINEANEILATIQWSFRALFRQAVADVRSGDFGKHPYVLSLANGGLTLASTGRTPNDVYEGALALKPKLQRGAIKVPTTTTAAQVQQLVNGYAGS
jgi:basic membrane lipoprotein Med (substrate-binding protein (PBP1-ABC) superfamily)